jgi:hypothetical protein
MDGESSDQFGYSVDIDGDIVVVGKSGVANFKGAVFVYRIIDTNDSILISQLAKLTASDGFAFDLFGWSVAINGNTILVGARGVNKNDSIYAGSAYLFGNPSNDSNSPEWTQLQILQPNDLTQTDEFGWSVALDENIAVVGTNDPDAYAAYVFLPVDSTLSSSSWTQMAKLTGSTGSLFGYSVAVAGSLIVVGARVADNTNGNGTGAAFVFTKSSSSSSWTQMTQLVADDGVEGDNFGSSVSISKDAFTIVVGAIGFDFNSGAAYLFRATITATATIEYTQTGKFVAADRESNDYLGISIAIKNNIVVVGAWGDDSNTGSVYIVGAAFSSPPPLLTTAAPTTASTADGLSTGEIVGIAAIAGVVVIVLGILNYCTKIKQQQQALPPPPAGFDAPIMADAVFEPPLPQPVNNRTLEVADVFLDPSLDTMAQTPPEPIIENPSIEKLPGFKDQVTGTQPPGPAAAAAEEEEDPKRNSPQQGEEETEQLPPQEELQLMQRQQPFHPDPPVATEQRPQLPTFKDQVRL